MQELSEEQFGHMKGGKPAKAIQQQKAKEQSKWQALCALWAQERPASTLGLDDKACPVSSVL
jgi:hypothetical protein